MVIEYSIPTLSEFFANAPLEWLKSIGLLLAAELVIGLFFSALRYGSGAFRPFINSIKRGIRDIVFISPRRVWAIARLTMKESVRRQIVVICLIFIVILMFAGWFLPETEDPAKLYLSFVLSTTAILAMLLVLFLSAFSLPTDFKTKTIYTVVTKPVRSSEMVFGRIVGISIIGSLVLLFMAVMSYFFVTLELGHTHMLVQHEDLSAIKVPDGETANDPKRVIFKGMTRITNGHRHEVDILADLTYRVAPVNGHTHEIQIDEVADEVASSDGMKRYRFTVKPEQGTLQSRTPIYGKLTFRNQEKQDKREGINVGNEWMYRSFIGGGSRGVTNEEAAIFRFSGLREDMFPRDRFESGIFVEMNLAVFRTYKAEIEKRVTASIALRNPKTGLRVEVRTFDTEEGITKAVLIPRNFTGSPQITQRLSRGEKGEQSESGSGVMVITPSDELAAKERANPNIMNRTSFDLFDDFVADGELEIWLQCVDRQQYLGVAQADLYIRGDDGDVALNFAKGFFGIWQQMLILTAFGVLFSTFLSGPVTLIATIGFMIAGFSKMLLLEIASNAKLGGGPLESIYRILTMENQMNDLPASYTTAFVKQGDIVYSSYMNLVGQAIPPLSDYYIYYEAVANGFNISLAWMAVHSLITLAYVVPLFFVAYLVLGGREVAK